MHRRLVIVIALAVVVPLAGCHMTTRPRLVAEALEGRKVRMQTAPYDGEYRLYAAAVVDGGPWPQPVGEPLAEHRLRRREPLGFRRVGGELSAVAGDAVMALESGSGRAYVWQMRADGGQVDRNKTMFVVAIAVTLVAGFAGASGVMAF